MSIEDSETEEEAFDAAESELKELAEEHAPDNICSACQDETPLSMSWARDVPKARSVKRVLSELDNKVQEFGRSPYGYYGEMYQVYEEAFWDACGSPKDCDVCHDYGPDECGHGNHNEDCPAYEGNDYRGHIGAHSG